VLVFRRPNAPIDVAEYGRYRVSDAANQTFEISSLRHESGVIGAWISTPRFSTVADQNGVGATNFINVVRGEGNNIHGSMSHGDGLDGVPAYFEGCADEVDAYGKWGSKYGQQWVCGQDGSTWEGSNGVAYRGYGTFEAHLAGDGRLSVSRGWCGGEHAAAETWHRLPRHFADMDPSTSPFRTGDFDGSSWAPKNFGWLGRGYDLLYTDPLDFGTAEDGIVSADPLFGFFFEDADGHASQTETKQIFGVSVRPQGKIDCKDKSTLIKTFEDMRDFSSKSYSGNIGVPGIASFSLSKSHSEVNKAATGRDHMYVLHWCDARNRTDTAKLRWSKGRDYLRQHLDPSFRQAIEQISIRESDTAELQAILARYGTHFSERVVYGGRFFERTEVDKYTYQAASEEKDGLSVQAEGTVKKVSIGGGYQSEDGTSEANQNAIEGTNTEKWAVGGQDLSVYSEWVKTVPQNPMPVDVRFRPVYELLSPVFFPDDPEIGVKQHLLKQATLAYFRQHNVQDLSSDPAMLHQTPPRHVCVRMEALTIERKDESPGDYYGGRLEAGFTDRFGQPVSGETVEVAFMDGYEAEDGTTWSTGSFTEGGKFPFDRIPSYGGFNDCSEYLGEGKGESYIRDGYLYLFGHIQVNDGKGASLPQAFPTGEHKFSLRDVGSSQPHYFTGEIPFEGNTARYRLKVWEYGVQPGEGE
jgi:hypothetical protein